MRELIYVSRAKLERFLDERKLPKLAAVLNLFELSIVSIFKVGISRVPSPQDVKSLEGLMKQVDQVVRSIENSENAALWWEDREVKVGDWIQFDTDQKYVNTSKLFLSWSSEPTGMNGQPDSILLLHGSARHIVGSVQFWHTPGFGEGRRIGGREGGSEPQLPVVVKEELKPFLKWKTGKCSLPGSWPSVRLRLRRIQDVLFEFHLHEENEVANLVELLIEEGSGTVSIGGLAGFARVTSIYDLGRIHSDVGQLSTESRLITATPLYVGRI